jgi:hypothetical protein
MIVCVISAPLSGCYVHTHTIGKPSTKEVEVYHQWYALLGFLPIGEEIDVGQKAGKKDIKITTKYDWLDVILSLTIPGFMGLGASRRTIIVEK